MKTRFLVFVTMTMLFVASPLVAFAAEGPAAAVTTAVAPPAMLGRTELKLRMTPSAAGGSVSANFSIDVIEIVQNDENVIGKITQYFRGRNGCTLSRARVVGAYDGETLILNVDVPENDVLSCRITIQVKNVDTKPEGLYVYTSPTFQMKTGSNGKFEKLYERGARLEVR